MHNMVGWFGDDNNNIPRRTLRPRLTRDHSLGLRISLRRMVALVRRQRQARTRKRMGTERLGLYSIPWIINPISEGGGADSAPPYEISL